MKVRKLMVLAGTAMAMSCLGVHLLVPVGAAEKAVVDDASADTAPEPAVDEAEAAPVEEPASLMVEARIGHDMLSQTGDRRTYVMVEVRGRENLAGASVQTSTALVIDTSGSMVGQRMVQAQEAARRWVTRAPDGDYITVLGFADQARELVPKMMLDASSRPFVLSKLNGLQAVGGTCLSCGVERALATVADAARMQRVIVLSDGRANLGIRNVEGIRALASVCRDRGISVSTIGLGTNYNEKVLGALAFDSNGLHHFVQNAAELPKVFEREERTLRATVASHVQASIELAPGVQLVRVLDRKFRREGQRVTVEVGPVAAGASRTVLIEVRVPGSLVDTPVATARVKFRDVTAANERTLERKLTTKIGKIASSLDGLVAMRLERALTSVALQDAAELFSQGRKKEALERLDRRAAVLEGRAVAIPQEAQSRGDQRARDIEEDLQRQLKQTRRSRRSFKTAPPKAKAPVKRAKPLVLDALL